MHICPNCGFVEAHVRDAYGYYQCGECGHRWRKARRFGSQSVEVPP